MKFFKTTLKNEDNYYRIWDAVKARFSNSRQTISHELGKLFSKPMIAANTPEGLMQLNEDIAATITNINGAIGELLKNEGETLITQAKVDAKWKI